MSALPTCDVCAGYGTPVSGKPCICGGTGYSHDEKAGLRHRILELSAENEALKNEKRSYQIMARNVSKLILEDRYRGILAAGQYSRGSGEVECKICRRLVMEHPEVLPTFHITCSNEIIKT